MVQRCKRLQKIWHTTFENVQRQVIRQAQSFESNSDSFICDLAQRFMTPFQTIKCIINLVSQRHLAIGHFSESYFSTSSRDKCTYFSVYYEKKRMNQCSSCQVKLVSNSSAENCFVTGDRKCLLPGKFMNRIDELS